MHLRPAEELAPQVAAILPRISARIAEVLPDAEIHHVGATSIPGALTKGDLDVMVRVESGRFAFAVDRLRARFPVKQPENWDPYFASFGSDTEFALPVGVQLVVKDSEADFFLFIRDYLTTHAGALARYNRAKQAHADKGEKDYRSAKDRVLTSLLALRPKPSTRRSG